MSQNIYYRPKGLLSEVPNASIALKNILIEKFGHSFDIQKTEIIESYFEALIDAKIEGADKLMELINKHGDLEIIID